MAGARRLRRQRMPHAGAPRNSRWTGIHTSSCRRADHKSITTLHIYRAKISDLTLTLLRERTDWAFVEQVLRKPVTDLTDHDAINFLLDSPRTFDADPLISTRFVNTAYRSCSRLRSRCLLLGRDGADLADACRRWSHAQEPHAHAAAVRVPAGTLLSRRSRPADVEPNDFRFTVVERRHGGVAQLGDDLPQLLHAPRPRRRAGRRGEFRAYRIQEGTLARQANEKSSWHRRRARGKHGRRARRICERVHRRRRADGRLCDGGDPFPREARADGGDGRRQPHEIPRRSASPGADHSSPATAWTPSPATTTAAVRAPPTVCAIDAIRGGGPAMSEPALLRDLNKARLGFEGAAEVATGHWGCGAFGNNHDLMFLKQWRGVGGGRDEDALPRLCAGSSRTRSSRSCAGWDGRRSGPSSVRSPATWVRTTSPRSASGSPTSPSAGSNCRRTREP